MQRGTVTLAKIEEVRHVSGIEVNFGVSETEFVAVVPSPGPRQERTIQFIHSDSESVVERKRQCFDLLWDKAMPAQARIDELERSLVSSSTAEATRIVIDRIYACLDCKERFLHSAELKDHTRATSHEKFREFPLI